MDNYREEYDKQMKQMMSGGANVLSSGKNILKKMFNPRKRKNSAKSTIVKKAKEIAKTIAKVIKTIIKIFGLKGIIIVLILMFSIGIVGGLLIEEENLAPASGQYNEGIRHNTLKVDDEGNLAVDKISMDNKFIMAYYQYFSKHSLYIICEEENIETPLQYNSNEYSKKVKELEKNGVKFKDKYDRESKFAMNFNSIYALDKKLNRDKYKYPEQIIKPVAYEKDGSDYKLKDIAISDEEDEETTELNVYSTKYVKNEDTGEFEKTDEKQLGVWDYGFGSILHYKKFTEKEKDIGTCAFLDVWNPNIEIKDADGTVISIGAKETWTIDQYNVFMADKTIENKEDYVFGIVSDDDINYESEERNTGTSYMIDWVLAPCGKISNSITNEWQSTGDKFDTTKTVTRTVKKKVLKTPEPVNEPETPNVDEEKPLEVPKVNEGEKEIIIAGAKSLNIDEFWEDDKKDADVFKLPEPTSAPVLEKPEIEQPTSTEAPLAAPSIAPEPTYENITEDIEFTVVYSGTVYKQSPTYNGDPNLDDFNGIDYYNDYFKYYSAYVPQNVIKSFNFDYIKSKANTFDNKYHTNISELLQNETVDDYASFISDVANDNGNEDEDTGNGQADNSKKTYEKYKQYIDVASIYYGIDPRFILGIIGTESGGNTNSKNGSSSATGLMQVISSYYEGKGTLNCNPVKVDGQKKINMKVDKREDICNPEIGIYLGCEVLREKLIDSGRRNWDGMSSSGEKLDGFNLFKGLAYYGPTSGKMESSFWDGYVGKDYGIHNYFPTDLEISEDIDLEGLNFGMNPSESAIAIWKMARENQDNYSGLPWCINDCVNSGTNVEICYYNWDGTLAGTVDTGIACTRVSGGDGSENGEAQSINGLSSGLSNSISKLSNYIPALLRGDTQSDDNPFETDGIAFEDRMINNEDIVYTKKYYNGIKSKEDRNKILVEMFAYQEGKRLDDYKEITNDYLQDYYTVLFTNIKSSYNSSNMDYSSSQKFFPNGYQKLFQLDDKKFSIDKTYPDSSNGITVEITKKITIKSVADYGKVTEISASDENNGQTMVITYDLLNTADTGMKYTRLILENITKPLVTVNKNVKKGTSLATIKSGSFHIKLQQSEDGETWVTEDPTWLVTGCSTYPSIGLPVPLYFQQDYAHLPYGYDGNTVASAGCGLTSCSMALSYLTGTRITPEDLLNTDWCSETSHYVRGCGTSSKLYQDAVKHYKGPGGEEIICKTITKNDVMNELASGHIVICSQNSRGRFTNGGHIILLRGVQDGKILVNDPNKHNLTKTDFFTNGVDTLFEPNDVLGISYNYSYSLYLQGQ